MKKIISWASATFLISLSSLAAPVAGSVSTATGGTGRGAIEPIDGVLLNPSTVARIKSKYFAFNYSKEQMAVTISDNGEESLFPAALAFVRTEKENIKIQDMALVLAYTLRPRLSIGTTVSLVEYMFETNGVELKERQTVADIGVSFGLTPTITLGATAFKALASESDFDPNLQKQKTFGIGATYTYQNFVRFRTDIETGPENKTDRLVFMGGMETYLNDWVVFRLGYQNNNVLSKNFQSAGMGFVGPQFSINYGYLANVADSKDDKHSMDIGVPF